MCRGYYEVLEHVQLCGLGNVPEDLEDFINLGVTWEEGFAGAHLSEDATDRPHIHASRVLPTTEQNLWRTVPQSDNLGILVEIQFK